MSLFSRHDTYMKTLFHCAYIYTLSLPSAAYNLQHLCRQGREAIQVTYELDVVSTEYQEQDSSPAIAGMPLDAVSTQLPVDVNSLIKGRLHLRLANVGHPPDPSLNKAG